MTESLLAVVIRRIQPSTGVVAPEVYVPQNGMLEPEFWEGLDVVSQGAVAEQTPQPPQTEATWQYQQDTLAQEQPSE